MSDDNGKLNQPLKESENFIFENEVKNEKTFEKFIKISPTLHVKYLKNDGNREIYKIYNPQTGSVEERELNDNEKREILIKEIKSLNVKFKNIKHDGNVTTCKFGSAYRKKRKKRVRMQKKSRKLLHK